MNIYRSDGYSIKTKVINCDEVSNLPLLKICNIIDLSEILTPEDYKSMIKLISYNLSGPNHLLDIEIYDEFLLNDKFSLFISTLDLKSNIEFDKDIIKIILSELLNELSNAKM